MDQPTRRTLAPRHERILHHTHPFHGTVRRNTQSFETVDSHRRSPLLNHDASPSSAFSQEFDHIARAPHLPQPAGGISPVTWATIILVSLAFCVAIALLVT